MASRWLDAYPAGSKLGDNGSGFMVYSRIPGYLPSRIVLPDK